VSTGRLPLIGRDRVLIEKLAKQVRDDIRQGDITPLYDTTDGRGFSFRVRVCGSDGKPTGHIARVQISLDEIERKPGEG
jgi:hypothetical protein